MRFFTLLLFILIFLQSFEQSKQYQNLLDTALSQRSELFVLSKPIKEIRLEQVSIRDYFDFHRAYANKILDTVMFLQIIRNSSTIDTTLWQDGELPNSLLVNSRSETISKKYAIKKLGLKDKKKIKLLKKQINRFNSTQTFDRNLYYISRPIFDNSKTYAIIQRDNGHSFLGGGGTIVLYQLQNTGWKEVGLVNDWRY